MECRRLYVTVISASGLRDSRLSFDMNPYVVASLLGGERHNNKQRTPPAHRDGGTSPRWDHALADPFTVDVAAARDGLLTLKLKIKTERTLCDRDIGRVDVPVGDLLELCGDGETKAMSYTVSTGGVLEFSYRFGESITVREGVPHQPPANQQPPMPGVGSVGGLIIGTAMSSAISGAMSGAISGAMSNAFGDY